MAVIRHKTIMDAVDAYARAVAYQRDDWSSALPQREALEAEVQTLADQLRGAVEALHKIRDKARLAEKDPGGAMAASWVEHVADDALTDLGWQ
jgi:hypothetical protein